MAVRIDAAADRLSHAGTFPAIALGFSLSAWVRIDVDLNDFQTVARLHDAGTLSTWATEVDGMVGPSHFTTSGSVQQSGVLASSVGLWTPVAVTRAAGSAPQASTVYRQVDGGGTTTSTSGSVSGGQASTPTGICIGGRSNTDASEWLNGGFAHFRYWTGVLSQAEFEAEWASATVVKSSGLVDAWALDTATDLTGVNGRTLAVQAGGALTTTTGPDLGPAPPAPVGRSQLIAVGYRPNY